MLSMYSGSSTGYLTNEVAAGRENYYTGAVAGGEPAGVWYGAGAETLGLRGEVSTDLMEAMYNHLLDPRDPASHTRAEWGNATALAAPHRNYKGADERYADLLAKYPTAGPEQRAELRLHAEKNAREATKFVDMTFSAPKSVSIAGAAFERAANEALAAGDDDSAAMWAAHHKAVEDAVMAGARASLDYLQDKAGYSRVGKWGQGADRSIDAHKFVTAQFLQHDSRNRDPQLHVHQAILNRVECSDGKWRALDRLALGAWRGGAGAVGERTMEAHLDRDLGLFMATRPDGQRDIAGVSQEMIDEYSSRRREIAPKFEELAAKFRTELGREPTARERGKMLNQATLATRAAKSHHGETDKQRADRWDAMARERVGAGLTDVAQQLADLGNNIPKVADTFDQRDVIERAMANVSAKQATFNRSDMTRAISDELPGRLGLPLEQVRPFLDGLTDMALAHCIPVTKPESVTNLPKDLTLQDGRSVFTKASGELWATPQQIAGERMLRQGSIGRGAAALSMQEVNAYIDKFSESGYELGADQAAALRGIATSGAKMETLVAAAGAGKSFTLGALDQLWRESGTGKVLGLASAQAAAEVLGEEGLTAANIAAWLGAQDRIAAGRALPSDEQFRIGPQDILAVDEASMVPTPDLVAIQKTADDVGAKVLRVGDPHQLAPVGPGGALMDTADLGPKYELTDVRRFSNDWEGTASLGLREGNQDSLLAYAKHGRLMAGGTPAETERAAARAWLADTLEGNESLLLAPTNEQAARLSAHLRDELARLGKVGPPAVTLNRQGTVAGLNDLVQARKNEWSLANQHGNTTAPVNRKTYRVADAGADGSLTVQRVTGHIDGVEQLGPPLHLPADYVSNHLDLAYASTPHAAIGRTVDTGHGLMGTGMNAAGAYVSLTRGHNNNTAWCATVPMAKDAQPGEANAVEERTPRAVLADLLQAAELQKSALAQKEQADLDEVSVETHGNQLIHGARWATENRIPTMLDELVAEGKLDEFDRVRLAADESMWSLENVLRRAELAGHEPAVVLADAVAGRGFDDARSAAQVLHSRIAKSLDGHLSPSVTNYGALIPQGLRDDWATWLHDRADAANDRRNQLGAEAAATQPQWAVEALGSPPDDPLGRVEWEEKASHAAAYRELTQYSNTEDPLGFAPPAGLPEKAALWRGAHEQLDLALAGAEEGALSDGALRQRIAAWEREQAWGPRWVGDQMEVTNQEAERHRRDAVVWNARAQAATDPAEVEGHRAAAVAAEAKAAALAGIAAQLDFEDTARSLWFLSSAGTREAAWRATDELSRRGVDLTDPEARTTAAEWYDAHREDQESEDPEREIRDEMELVENHEPERDTLPIPEQKLETGVADIRETAIPDASERQDPDTRYRVPARSETDKAVERAEEAVAEVRNREAYDTAREAEEQARQAQVTRYAEEARTAQQQQQQQAEQDAAFALER